MKELNKPDEAIEKYGLANHVGPHFADPLEGWGEALMAQHGGSVRIESQEDVGTTVTVDLPRAQRVRAAA